MLTGHGEPLAGLDPAHLFAPVANETTLGLAVSGGADSLALMVLAAAWRDGGAGPRIIVYTVDHNLRPEAAAEAAMVAAVAARLNLESRVLRWTASKPTAGLQAAARAARYRLMAEAMKADGITILLTAHHRSDQAETLLMRMAHGSGVSGLAGMRPMAEAFGLTLFRPLLDVSPEALMTIVARAGLVPAVDPTNDDYKYERVRWRAALAQLAPLGLDAQRLGQLARRLQRIDALAESDTDDFVATHGAVDFLGVVRLDRARLRTAQPEIVIRALSRAIRVASGRPCRALAAVERLGTELATGADVATTLSGARIETQGGAVALYREAGRMAAISHRLSANERFDFDGRFLITTTIPALATTPNWTRADYEKRFGEPLDAPVAALKTVPLVTDAAGEVLALGMKTFSPSVAVKGGALTDRS